MKCVVLFSSERSGLSMMPVACSPAGLMVTRRISGQ